MVTCKQCIRASKSQTYLVDEQKEMGKENIIRSKTISTWKILPQKRQGIIVMLERKKGRATTSLGEIEDTDGHYGLIQLQLLVFPKTKKRRVTRKGTYRLESR